MPDLRYPVGPLAPTPAYSTATRAAAIGTLVEAPARFRLAVAGLDDRQLDTPYRPEGWTVRQVVHHVADSHMNAYIRTKLALSGDHPTVVPYPEQIWAEMADAKAAPVATSLDLLDALHARWTALLEALEPAAFARTLLHPERGSMTLDDVLALYEWHSRHHLAHITGLKEREGW
ncbi:MAG: bacillithiol transferase BstA [Vicinamibacterales bacterium]